MRVLPYGRGALLVECDSAADVVSVSSALRSLPGIVEAVPGARTVLLRGDPARWDEVRAAVADVVAGPAAASSAEEVVLDVVYDGADLAPLAGELSSSVEALVRMHSGAAYTVAFCGFAPGFAYLTGLPRELHAARLAEPRTRVPAGSVAVAGEFAGVYPRSSPGGWRLLGRTGAALWDVERDPPALLAPGTPVRFRPARATTSPTWSPPQAGAGAAVGRRAVEVLAVGPLATVQDLGRPGHAALGVPRSGAFDGAALRRANRLVGNAEGDAAIEVLFGGLTLRLTTAATVALTGAPCAGLDPDVAVSLPAGSVVRLGPPSTGVRSYLAVRGGIAVEPVLGSRSTDTLSGLGPAPLSAGQWLPLGEAARPVAGEVAPGPRTPAIVVDPGPRADWFDDALPRLVEYAWTVRADSDRVGVRLDGPALARVRDGELPSEATVPGAIQVPVDGRPIVFGPDAPVTGGYPVVGVVRDLDALAQLRPGDVVRFAPGR